MASDKSSSLSIWRKIETDFVFKRAFRFGECRSKDLMEAFSCNYRTADRRIEDAIEFSHGDRKGALMREGYRVLPAPSAPIPACAGELSLLDSLITQRDDTLFFCLSGLRESEIRAQRSQLVQSSPMGSGSLLAIAAAIASDPLHPRCLRLRYVPMNRGATAADGLMRAIPLSLQVIGDQVSLYCMRLEKYDPSSREWVYDPQPRTLILSRILEAVPDRPPKKFRYSSLPNSFERVEKVDVTLNPELTPDQKSSMAHELNVRDGRVSLPASASFHFLRAFANRPASSGAVWPPLLLRELPGESR